MEQLFEFFDKYIDFKLVVLIILASYWAKKFLTNLLPRMSMAIRVLLFSTLITVFYYLLLQRTGVFNQEDLPVYFISYFTATSFYELAFAPLENAIRRLLGLKTSDDESK